MYNIKIDIKGEQIMSKENMFELATRKKIRFPYKGLITVEDLWDLSAVNLDRIFKELKLKTKKPGEESLLETKESTAEEELLETQIEIVRYIFSIKLSEAKKKEEELQKKAQKAKIEAILAVKEDEELKAMPVEELRKLL